MKNVLYALLFYVLCTLHITANSSLNPIDITYSHHTIGEYAQIYEDPSASMQLSDIRKLPTNEFTSLNQAVSSHGFSESSFWYIFDVLNKENEALPRLFVFEPAWLDHVTITVISPKGKTQAYLAGNRYNYDKRSIEHYLSNIRHTFEPGLSKVYMEIRTRDPFIVSIALMDEFTFLSENSFYSFLIGLFYGGMIALLIYNLFLYFGIKKHFYLFYVLYLFSFLLVNSAYNGYSFMYLFSSSPEVQNWSQSVLSYTFVTAALLFAISFLNLKENHPKLYHTTRYILYVIWILFVLTALVGGYHYNIMFGIILVMLGSTYIAGVALYALVKGNRSARFFLLGALSGLIGVCITAMTLLSIIPYTYYTFKASDFGMFIDIILLSLALTDRMRITQQKRIQAEHDAQTDALTGLLNRRAFYQISQKESEKLLRYRKDFSVLMLDIDNLKKVNDSYGHESGDQLIKLVATYIKENMRENDYIFRLGGDEFVLFLPETREEEAYLLAERLRKNIITINLDHYDKHLTISCSIGISGSKKNDQDINTIIKRADEALYEVKRSGKNKVKVKNIEATLF